MIDRLTENLVPVLLLKVAGVSQEDKIRFAEMLHSLCAAYLANEPLKFRAILSSTSFSDDWKKAMIDALWPEIKVNRENSLKR